MSSAPRSLKATYARSDAFLREYESNLANGGIFVATEAPFALREKVRVKLVLGFCRREVELDGEVVHRVTREMGSLGGRAGVAISFDEPAAEIRQRLAPLLGLPPDPPAAPVPAHHKPRAPRAQARVPVRIEGAEEALAGRTRNLSRSGVLVSVPGRGVPVGEKVRVTLTHPTRGDAMDLAGTVVRELGGERGVEALAIRFDAGEKERPAVERFVEGIQSVEHARALGGISGDLSTVGILQLLQMLGASVAAGTLSLRRSSEEALIGFEKGMLRYVRAGPASGMKALVRLVGWGDGSFEFHARLDPIEAEEAPLPLEAALLDATRMYDEGARVDRRRLAPDAVPRLAPAAAPSAGADLGKLERAVLDLVQAGFPVRRILDVIPEPDPAILRALESLVDEGLIDL